jgi:pimeloyl-ACP methyl ester carboxylesterase
VTGQRGESGRILRRLLLGCGLAVGLAAILMVGLAAWLFSGSGDMDSPHHPFRSAAAKERYLELYDSRAREWPIPADTLTVSTSFGPTFVRISGPDSAPPLVLLHGAGGNSLQWRPNATALSERHRSYAVDVIYDYGRSVYTRVPTSADDFTGWLDELFDVLELGDSVSLVGLSYGGWLASQYAVRFPNRLDRVVLLAPAGTVLPLPFSWIRRAVLCALPSRYFTRSFLYWLLQDLAAQDEAGRELLEREIDAAYLAIRSYKLTRLVNPAVMTDSKLHSISVPTLFLVGENEKIYPALTAIERLNRVAPQIETQIIPHAGHDLTVVQTDLVNRKIVQFLTQH